MPPAGTTSGRSPSSFTGTIAGECGHVPIGISLKPAEMSKMSVLNSVVCR